jgi:hypothetical protein
MLWTMSPQTIPSPEEIRQVTREILSRPEFQAGAPWSEWGKALNEWWADVFRRVVIWSQAHPTARWGAVAVLSVVLLLLLPHLISTLRTAVSRNRHVAPRRYSSPAMGWTALAGVTHHWDEALHTIRLALHEGDGYRAIWLLHRLFLGALDHRGLLAFATWKTNMDYLRECPSTSTAYRLFVDLSQAYEQMVYAHQPVPLHTIAALLTRVEHEQRQHRV